MNTDQGLPHTSTEASMLAAMVDEVDYGLMLLVDGRVGSLNRAARAALAAPDCALRLESGQLRAVDAFEDSVLQATLRSVARSGRRDWVILRATGTTTVAALIPHPGGPLQPQGVPVTLVLGRQAHCARLTLDWYCRRHGLSPAESRVLEEVLAGLEPSAIARKHQVAMSTVRTQIAAITEKTGQRGIRQLLLALAGLPPVMPLLVSPAVQAAPPCGQPSPQRPCAA
jgi:DNA-binding CsgD family transcriptional regulator